MKRPAAKHRSETMPASPHAADVPHAGDVPPAVAVPPGTPRWISPELIEKTIRTWQPYYEKPLTPEDAVAMITGVGRLVDVLSRGMD